MQDKIINYKVTLETAGPVHIGSGTDINKKDCLYMTNEKRVYIMDSMKVFEGMKKNNLLRSYEQFLLDPEQKNFAVFVREHGIKPDEYKGWASYTLFLNDILAVTDNSRSNGGGIDTISAFIKDAYGCPYIPGSSLKGALRTAFENTFCQKDMQKYQGIVRNIETEKFENRARYLSASNRSLSAGIFNLLERDEKIKSNAVNDIFSFIRVSDSEPLNVSDLVLCQKVDVYTDGNTKNLPLKRECLKPGTRITFNIEIDKSYMDIKGGEQIDLSGSLLYEVIDMSYKNYCDSFLSAFKKVSSVSSLAGHLIYIGGGSGFATKTSVYPLFDNRVRAASAVENIMVNTTSPVHKHRQDIRKYNISPHMRKCTRYKGELYDMGLCKIEIN